MLPRITLLLIVLGLFAHVALAQRYDSLPEATLTFDNTSYDRFEPILTTLMLSNPTNKIQNFGPAAWPFGESLLTYELEGPDGEPMGGHQMYYDALKDLINVSYRPEETHTTTFDLLLSYPVWEQTGTYTLRVLFPDPTDQSLTQIASGGFSVTNPAGLDEAELDTLGKAFSATFSEDPWLYLDSWPEAVIGSAVENGSYPSYLNEFSRYVYALYADLDCRLGSGSVAEADSRYASLMSNYPNSVYAAAAVQRSDGLRGDGGTESYVNQIDTVFTLNLKVAQQSMSTGLMNVVPSTHPYSVAPWYYGELEPYWVPSANAVDWILVSIVDTAGVDNVVSRSAAPLRADSTARVQFLKPPPGHYFVVVDHRNHVAVMSDTTVDMIGYYAEHDFTTGHALGANAQKEIEPGVYAMWAADANADGVVDSHDLDVWRATRGATGYDAADFDMDGTVTTADSTMWAENSRLGARTGIPDTIWETLFGNGGEDSTGVDER